MTNPKLEQKVIQIIASQLTVEPDDISADSDFVEDLGADSLDIVEMVMEIEEEFNIEIPDEDVEHLESVQHLVTYLSKSLAKNS